VEHNHVIEPNPARSAGIPTTGGCFYGRRAWLRGCSPAPVRRMIDQRPGGLVAESITVAEAGRLWIETCDRNGLNARLLWIMKTLRAVSGASDDERGGFRTALFCIPVASRDFIVTIIC
jgi:hypothetical protein